MRDTLVYLNGAFEYTIDLEWTQVNPVRRATKPKRRRAGDANPDLQFLTLEEPEAVLRTFPDVVADGRPPRRRARRVVEAIALTNDDDLVFAHPVLGVPLDGSKVSKRFKLACAEADVRVVRFHDLRHTFATRLASTGQPIRAIQEFLGQADIKTTQVYAHYAPSAREVEMVNQAFAIETPQPSATDAVESP